MKIKTIKSIGLGLALAAGITTAAKADLIIDYSVGGVGPITVGSDTVTLGAFSSSLTIAPFTAVQDLEINTLTWIYSASAGDSTGTTVSRPMTISLAVGSQTISQVVTLKVTKSTDAGGQTLLVASAPAVDFDFTEGGFNYDLNVLGDSDKFVNGAPPGIGGTLTGDLTAQFSLTATPVPEPTTMIAGAMMLLPFGASTLRGLRKNRTV